MLSCRVDLENLNDTDLECRDCRKCTGSSKLDYPFERDLLSSDDLVLEIMKHVEENTGCKCKKTTIDKNPDINVYRDSTCQELICRIESKFLEGQAFMKAKEKFGLYAKETLVVDELNRLYRFYGYARAFTRKTGRNDFKNGIKMGVTDKYHFSIRECEPIEKLAMRINEIKDGYK